MQKLVSLARRQPPAQLVLEGRGALHGSGEQGASFGDEMEHASPPVRRMGTPRNKTTLLQLIDQSHHAARRNLQQLPDDMLRLSFVPRDRSQHRELTRFEIQGVHDAFEPFCGGEAELGEHEAHRLEGRGGRLARKPTRGGGITLILHCSHTLHAD